MTTLGAGLIAQERTRQRLKLGWTLQHDDAHVKAELVIASAGYLTRAVMLYAREIDHPGLLAELYPPICSPADDDDVDACLVKAGALIAAELDRRARARLRDRPASPCGPCATGDHTACLNTVVDHDPPPSDVEGGAPLPLAGSFTIRPCSCASEYHRGDRRGDRR